METAASVDWIPGIAMLAAGLIVGLMLMRHAMMSSRIAKEVKPDVDLDIRDLEAKKEVLLGELRELEDTASKQTPEQLASERRRLELEAASVLMELDRRRAGGEALAKVVTPPQAVAAAPAVETPAAPASPFLAFFWGIASAAVLVGLGYFAFSSATTRDEGGSMTGNPGGMQQASADPNAQAQQQQLAQEVQRLQGAVQSNPGNLDARLDLAYLQLMQHDMPAVEEQLAYVLAKRPGDPRAISYKALVKMSEGDSPTAVALLKEALHTDPNLTEGYIHLAIVYSQMNRMDDATAAINEAIKRHPDQAAQLNGILNEIRAEAAQPQMASAAPAPAGQPAAGGQGGDITGTISTASSVNVAPGTVIFLVARPAGVAGGPPLAVKRMIAGSFPMPFELSAADSMMGQALPAKLRIEVRADADGDPMTRPPTDPVAIADAVSNTASGVQLTLKR